MKIIVKTNFPFNVQNIGFSSHGELIINLSSDNENPKNSYVYEAEFGESSAATRPVVTLLNTSLLPGKKEIQRQAFPTSVLGITIRIF